MDKMGVFDFLFRKKSSEDYTLKINNTLRSSFSNVKKDILHVHKTVADHKEHTNKRFEEIERKLGAIAVLIQNQQIHQIRQPQPKQEDTEESESVGEGDQLVNILNGLPRAELKLFRTLYELQLSLNAKNISYKSLASYLYPGKEYNSIRSTITQFVLRLYTEGLVDKKRIGKETYVSMTNLGHKILKKAKVKRLIRDIEATT